MDDLRKLAEAVGGTWEVLDDIRVSVPMPCEPVDQFGWDSVCVAVAYPDRRFDHKANAAYIAACSPDRILKLLGVVEKAQTVDEKLRCNPVFPDDDAAVELGVALRALSGAGTRTASDKRARPLSGGVPTGLSYEQIEAVIERHVGGNEITDDEHRSMLQFARALLSAGAPSSLQGERK